MPWKGEEMKKILIVDDDRDFIETIKSRLEVNGFEVVCGYSGREGLELAKSEKPDLLLLNIMMSELSGITTAIRLMEEDETKSIPIILISGIKREELEFLAQRIAVEDFITKPFDSEELLKKIKQVLKL